MGCFFPVWMVYREWRASTCMYDILITLFGVYGVFLLSLMLPGSMSFV